MIKRNHLFAILGLATTACSGDILDSLGDPPVLLAASRDTVAVGQSMEFIGNGFFTGEDGYTVLRFNGKFDAEDGTQNDVNLEVRPHWASGSRLLWANLGPFDNPFSQTGDTLGTFHGTVTPVNIGPHGQEGAGEGLPLDLKIGPSIIVRDLSPVNSGCQKPARRLIGGFPYQISVEALGFEPVSFTYELIGEPDALGRARVWRQAADGHTATFGKDGEIVLSPVTGQDVFYTAEILITARNAKEETIASVYAFGVHQPIEYIDWGKSEIAEIEAPQPVSGCIAGGLIGQHVSYSESHSDNRSRQVSYHWDESWTMEHSANYSTSHEERHGVNMNFSRSDEHGWSSHWDESDNWNFEGHAGASFFGLVDAGGSVSKGFSHSHGGSTQASESTGFTVGHDYSTADTESWAYTTSQSMGTSDGGAQFWEVSSGDTISKEVSGEIIPSMYGVWYRQATRIVRPGSVVVYNQCGDPEVIGEALFQDFTWAVALGQDTSCPPLPKSSLPEAQCVIAPCAGGG